jgi:hypothetical protein
MSDLGEYYHDEGDALEAQEALASNIAQFQQREGQCHQREAHQQRTVLVDKTRRDEQIHSAIRKWNLLLGACDHIQSTNRTVATNLLMW